MLNATPRLREAPHLARAETVLEDLRLSFRSITRSRGLTAVLLLSLALATGTNAAVCGTVSALLFGTPAGVDGDGLVEIHTRMFSGAPYGPSSFPDYLDVAATVRSTVAVAAYEDRLTVDARIRHGGRLVRVAAVTGNFFQTLALSAPLGRLLHEADEGTTPRGAVISERLWREIGAPGDITGSALTLRDVTFSLVGVAPPGFLGLRAGRPVDVWVPLAADAETDGARGRRRLSVIARVAPGASVDDVNEDLAGLTESLAAQHPGTNRGVVLDPGAPRALLAVAYSPLDADSRSQARGVGAIVVGAVVLLLVSACVNAGSLLLARASARRRELAVKLALGATGGRLVRQVVIESVLVCLAGAGLGLLFARWTSDVLPVLFSPEHAEMLDTSPDAVLILVTMVTVCASGALFALVPARQDVQAPTLIMLRGDPGEVSPPTGGTLRGALVCTQIATSTVLLILTGLLISGLSRTLESDTSRPLERLATMTVERRNAYYQPSLIDGLGKLPEVEAVGWTSTLPLARASARQFQLQAGAAGRDAVEFQGTVVAGNYFEAAGLKLLEGRHFDERDRPRTPPVVIVDETVARQYFGTHAVGEHLVDESGRHLEIVGVVASSRYRTLQPPPGPTVYFPLLQQLLTRGHIVARTKGDASALLPVLTARVNEIDPRVEVTRPMPLTRHLARALVLDALVTTLVGVCGALALAMSIIGVYGVMSDAVHRRTREIGLRMALGAQRLQVVRLVLKEAAVLAPAGLAIGVVAAAVLSQTATTVIYRLPSLHVATIGAAPALLLVVVALAAVVPLRRALAVSPTIALRGN